MPNHCTSRRQARALLIMTFGIAACGTPAPTGPDSSLDAGPLMSAVAGGPGVVASVRGGAHYQLNEPPPFVGDFKWIYRFQVQAEKRADGSDRGTVRFKSKIPKGRDNVGFPGDWSAEVEVTCLEVDGGTAWLSGPVVDVRTDSPLGPGLGDTALLIVQDNGPVGPDVVNVGPAAAFGVATCRDRPALFPDALVDGNLTVVSGS